MTIHEVGLTEKVQVTDSIWIVDSGCKRAFLFSFVTDVCYFWNCRWVLFCWKK